MKRAGLLFGAGFGFLLAAAGLNRYDVIHNMLRLKDIQPYLIMGSAMVVAMPILFVLERRGWTTPLGGKLALTRARVAPKNIYGGAVFGAGWAVAGTCPGPALAMLASGAFSALFVMAGLVAGILFRDAVVARGAASPVDTRGLASAAS